MCFISCNKLKTESISLNSPENTKIQNKKTNNNYTGLDSTTLGINFKANGNYNTIQSKINSDKSYFKALYATNKNKAIDSASKYLYHKLINDITPHWYGTTWDFNGHTNTPNEGLIACGYFVSTTLKHLGFNLNRYKMAQQAALNEAKALQPKQDLKIYSNLTFKSLKSELNQVYNDGIYLVGLDNHVGYLLIKDKELYFLHSSYCDNKVVIELAETSPCFRSNLYVFAEITTNDDLIKKWMFNETLVVPTS
ncbi:hypothetical protein [Olleya sp. R77988]|uniref:hypothetical protein n=1 Tax=Olleya sp. R77988 TaxID=3093875 RepID=UPI0037CBEFD7